MWKQHSFHRYQHSRYTYIHKLNQALLLYDIYFSYKSFEKFYL